MAGLNAETASRELRRILVSGRLDGAVELLSQLGGADALEARSSRQALSWIVEGIQEVVNQDTLRGIEHLEQAAAVTSADDSLRWVALHWMARGTANQGELDRAHRAATEAATTAEQIGPHALSLSLLTLAEVAALAGRPDETLDHLRRAIQVLKDVEDEHGAATALLQMARTLCRLGRTADGQSAAENATQADPTWPDAAVFLSERALAAGEMEQAIEHIASFLKRSPPSPLAERQRWLIEAVRQGRCDATAVTELLRLRDGVPSVAAIEEMKGCQERFPDFHQLRELTAWTLYKLKQTEEAEAQFKAMTALSLDPHLRASVSLGIACIASGKHRHPAARVRAASGSFPMVKPVVMSSDDDAAEPPPPNPPPHTQSPPKPPPTLVMSAPPPEVAIEALPISSSPAASQRRHGPSPEVTFTGDLQLFAVPDLLDFLQSSRRSGTLIITSSVGTAAVHMVEGRITGAAAPGATSLGDLLLERGALTAEGLSTALQWQQEAESQDLLGMILIQQKLVDRETLETALVDQVRMALLEAVTWQEGRFAFQPDKADRKETASDQIPVDLDTRAVLMDVLRQYDEMCK